MNLHELDRYKLSDAVKFNARLNPKLWGKDEHLKPDVREALIKIADDFRESLGVKDLDLKDITLSGSNAAYTYTPNSDIDLHLVVNMPNDAVYRELFDAKKYAYNNQHTIRIGGYDVELYVQDVDQTHVTQGEYSLLNNDWIQVPRRQRADVVDQSTRSKYQDLKQRIQSAIKSQDHEVMAGLMSKIKQLRQSGLDQHGEFGSENLAFKMLRTQGYIQKLVDARNAAKDQELSIDERVQPRVTYGFATESKDSLQHTINQFAASCIDYLGIDQAPEIKLHTSTDWSEKSGSFGQYDPDANVLHLATAGRHTLDILRTMAHEFTHRKQAEKQTLPDNAGETGSRWEDEANAMAGRIMRHWAEKHPEMFAHVPLEEASGYIPTRKQARDPRFIMALTKDVRPGATGKEANKLGLQTDAQGRPALLTAKLNESLAAEFAAFAEAKSYGYDSTPLSQVPGAREDELGNQEATGPEFPPQWPAGTTKIDVTDLTDWYQLGMDISDLDDADPADYNQGPPQTVIVFPSDEAEQGYLKQFKRLGLKTHDMDPDVEGGEDVRDKHQPKTDEDLIAESIDDMLFEINMGSKNLRKEAAKTGAIAGMEFEMIVPNVEGGNDDGDLEADYSQDEGVSSIQDVYDFFYDGDYNSRGDVTRLRDRMTNEYYEWLSEQFDSRWDSDESEFVYNYLKENASTEEIAEILSIELDADNYPDTVEQQTYLDAADKVVEAGYGNYWYDAAREAAQEDFNQTADLESEWLESRDLNTMQNIENEYDITWPHWEQQGGGEASIEDIANEFQDAIGRDVRASGNYHSGRVERPSPTAQHYIVEPDGSLEADDSDDVGLEFVSPPLPIDEILSDLNKVKQWAGIYGCYTNDSTGLHINISVPDYSRENLDFVKLALLMGDEYVLDLFGRASNTYAKSAMKLVRDQVRQKPDEAERLLDKMKGNLDSLASKAIHSGATSKYTSINTKDGHIEFRSPGGDWLDENFDQIENTLLRFTVAMSAALNPEMYREEYLKKLYKLLTQDQKGDDTIKYFSEYVAGKIPKAALRSFVKQAQLERKMKKDPTGGEKYWWRVSRPGYSASVEVVATNKEEAIEKGRSEYPEWANSTIVTAQPLRPYEQSQQTFVWKVQGTDSPRQRQGIEVVASNKLEAMQKARQQWNLNTGGTPEQEFFRLNGWIATPVREAPATADDTATDTGGNWGIWINALDRFANEPGSYSPGQTPTSMRFPSQAAAEQWIEQQRAERPNLRNDIEVRKIEPAEQTTKYEIYNKQTGNAIEDADGITNDAEALVRLNDYIEHGPHTLNRDQATAMFGIRTTGGVGIVDIDIPIAQGRAATSPTGQWKIIDGLGREVYRFRPAVNTRAKANELAAVWAREYNWDGNYQVEPAEDSVTGSTADRAQQQMAPGTFTGAWRIVDSDTGRELYRFSGIGNSQADANRVAADWLRQNGPEDANMTEIEVLPIVS